MSRRLSCIRTKLHCAAIGNVRNACGQRRRVFSSINNSHGYLYFQRGREQGNLFLSVVHKECAYVSAHMRICDVRWTNEGANRPAEEIDAALSPAKRHATSLMHMTHVGREEEWRERKRERKMGKKKTKRKKSDRQQVRRAVFYRRGLRPVATQGNVTPKLLYQRCVCHTLCVAILLARAMSERIRSGGISSMLRN